MAVNIRYWTATALVHCSLFTVHCLVLVLAGPFYHATIWWPTTRDPACAWPAIIFYSLHSLTVLYGLHLWHDPGHETRKTREGGEEGAELALHEIARKLAATSLSVPLASSPDNFIILIWIWISMQCPRRANHRAIAPLSPRVCTFGHELTLYARFFLERLSHESLSAELALSQQPAFWFLLLNAFIVNACNVRI